MDAIAGLQSGQSFLSGLRALDLSVLSPGELATWSASIAGLKREVDALQLAVLAATSGKTRETASAAGETDLTQMIANQSGTTRRFAGQQIRLAQQVDDAPAIKAVMGEPGMSPVKAQIVTDALAGLPETITPEQRTLIETKLAEQAPGLPVRDLKTAASRALEHVDVARADETENAALERDEAAQADLVRFWIGQPDEATGMVPFGGKTDPITADMLRSLIEAKTAPRHRQDPTGHRPDHAAVMGEAFNALVRQIPATDQHGGVPATLVVTISEDALLERTNAAGVTSHGTRISASQARQLACNAGIVPAVLGGNGLPLDLGRRQREFSTAQRLALAQRDLGCAHPGCSRPPGWTEAHHIDHWVRDEGPTDLRNGVLLCAHHHRAVHTHHIAIRINADDGIPEFRLHGQWRRNHRYRPPSPPTRSREPALVGAP